MMDWVWFLIWVIVGAAIGGVELVGYLIWSAYQTLTWFIVRRLLQTRPTLSEWISERTFREWLEEGTYYRPSLRIVLWIISWVLWVAMGFWIWL